MKRVQRIAQKWLKLRIDSQINVSIRIAIYFSSMFDIIQRDNLDNSINIRKICFWTCSILYRDNLDLTFYQ